MNDYQTWFSEKWAKSGQAILGQSRPQNRPCLIFFYLVDLICLNLHIEEWTKNSPDLNCRGGLWGHIFTVLEIFPPPPPPFCYDLCFFFKSINWQNPLPSLIGSQPQLGTIWQQVVAWLLKFKSGSLEGFWPQNEVSYFFLLGRFALSDFAWCGIWHHHLTSCWKTFSWPKRAFQVTFGHKKGVWWLECASGHIDVGWFNWCSVVCIFLLSWTKFVGEIRGGWLGWD